MSEAVVAKRYADALFQLGEEKAVLDTLLEEFRTVREVFEANTNLIAFLEHPRVDNKKKKQFIDEVFQGLSADVVNTMKLLVERQRSGIIPSIIDHFIQLVNDAKGIAVATAYSVRELEEAEKKELERAFAKRFNKKTLHFETRVDPTILGGIKIRLGNTIYDGTISGKLKRMERNIVTANK